MTESAIPIVIGITGHRDLRAEEREPIRALVRSQLTALRNTYPNSTFRMLNSLAEGADMLCAELALELKIPLICPLPMAVEDYALDFQGQAREQFFRLLAQGDAFVCPGSAEGREDCYRQAGIYIASHCHILLALWDGDDAKRMGCGTAAAVYSAQMGLPHAAFPCGSLGSILQIRVNRASTSTHLPLLAQWLGEGPDTELLSRTDLLNADAKSKAETAGYPLLPEACLAQPQLRKLEALYRTADGLSVAFQKRHTTSLLAAAAYCVALVLGYLMYDELDCRGFLMLYGGVMLIYGLNCWWVTKRQYLERYLQYRLLAEAARIQCCISGLGYGDIVTESFTWTQKRDAAWVHCAVCTALTGATGPAALSEEQAREIWIRDQLRYHIRAKKSTEKKHRLNLRICQGTLLGMLSAFAVTVILEYGFPDFTIGSVLCGLAPQSWMKILWGTVSSITLFAADYFGKLELGRKQVDHRKMSVLFQKADEAFAQFPQNRKNLFRKLAAEELIENGNWYSYSQESTISFDL